MGKKILKIKNAELNKSEIKPDNVNSENIFKNIKLTRLSLSTFGGNFTNG